MRRLNDEERALWKGVTRLVKPLRAPSRDDSDEVARDATKQVDRRAGTSSPPPSKGGVRGTAAHPKPGLPPLAPLAPLGRRLKKRVARGTHTIDVRIDLHGMTQSEAHLALVGFLRSAQARGASIALVITGKGSTDTYGGRGVLRRQVPQWLRLPEFRGLIVGFESAGHGHGGEGALYVRLRKSRSE